MHKKLGIIAGGGAIPQDLINFCKENKRDYFVIAIEGNADKALIDDSIPHAWIRIGQAGTGFKKLAEEKVEEVIMIGTIKRPTLKDLVPDMRRHMIRKGSEQLVETYLQRRSLGKQCSDLVKNRRFSADFLRRNAAYLNKDALAYCVSVRKINLK